MRSIVRLFAGFATLLVGGLVSAASVQVTDEVGYPLPGAIVQRLDANELQIQPMDEQYTTVSISGADGIVRVDPSTSKSLLLFAKPGRITVALDAQQPLPITVALGPHAEIGGYIYDDHGTTITNAEIGPVLPIVHDPNAEEPKEQPPVSPAYARTGKDGFFRVGGLDPGQYSFLVRAPHLAPEIGLAGTGVITSVSLSTKGTTVSGIILGSKDRQPQPDVIVEASAGLMKLYTTSDQKGEFTVGPLQPAEWKFNTSPSAREKVKISPVLQNGRSEKGRELVLLHNQGVTLAGRFLDSETSAPIANLPLRVNTFEADAPTTGSTDAQGNFYFERVDAFRNISLQFDGEQYAFRSRETGQWGERIHISTHPARDITTITVPLVARAFVRGKVVGPNGKPVPQADVVLRSFENVDEGYDEPRQPAVIATRSNMNGELSMVVFPTGRYEVRAAAPFLAAQPFTYTASTTQPTELLVQMRPLVTLKGKVTDAAGKPLHNARVEFISSADNTGSLAASGRSDVKGSFGVQAVYPPKVRVVATHPNYDTAVTTDITVLEKNNPAIPLQFPAGNVFAANVMTGSGLAIENASVQIVPAESDNDVSTVPKLLLRKTNLKGQVKFELGGRRLAKVVVRHPEFATFEAADIQLPQQSFDVRMKTHPTVSVTVKAPANTPEDKLNKIIYLLQASTSSTLGGEPAPNQFRAIRHTQASIGHAVFDNVEPGWYKAAMSTDDEAMYSESKAELLMPDAIGLELELSMAAGSSLTGRITDEQSGEPIAGAEVHVQVQGGTPMEFEVISKPTDDKGQYRIEVLPAAQVAVSAVHPSYSEQAQVVKMPASGQLDLDFKLNKSVTTLSGRVTVDGESVREATLVMYDGEDMKQWVGSAVTDDDGRYTMEGVPQGNRLLIAEALWGKDAKGLRRREKVMVQRSKATKDVQFKALVRVSGRVAVSTAEADLSAKHMLFFTSLERFGDLRRVVLGAEGDYEVFLEPGAYTIGLADGPGLPLDVPKSRGEVVANYEFDELAQVSGINVRTAPQLE